MIKDRREKGAASGNGGKGVQISKSKSYVHSYLSDEINLNNWGFESAIGAKWVWHPKHNVPCGCSNPITFMTRVSMKGVDQSNVMTNPGLGEPNLSIVGLHASLFLVEMLRWLLAMLNGQNPPIGTIEKLWMRS